MNIAETYKQRVVASYKSSHGETKGLALPDWLVGLELEIEGMSPELEHQFGGIAFEADGSLRAMPGLMAIEGITKPLSVKYVAAFLAAFFKKFNLTEAAYSERCSTHVHFNVQPLTFDQLSTICLLYQTVERLLFEFVGHGRGDGIFCVPWHQSNMSYSIVNKMAGQGGDGVVRRWQKYSALNLLPVSSQGTIEFRHLHGTCDVQLITQWIALICRMFEYSLRVPLEDAKRSITDMNTVSNYRQWLEEVFQGEAGLLQTGRTEEMLSRGVIDSKLMLSEQLVENYSYLNEWRHQPAPPEPAPATPWGARNRPTTRRTAQQILADMPTGTPPWDIRINAAFQQANAVGARIVADIQQREEGTF